MDLKQEPGIVHKTTRFWAIVFAPLGVQVSVRDLHTDQGGTKSVSGRRWMLDAVDSGCTIKNTGGYLDPAIGFHVAFWSVGQELIFRWSKRW